MQVNEAKGIPSQSQPLSSFALYIIVHPDNSINPSSLSCILTLSSLAPSSIQLPLLSVDTARQSVLGRDGGRRICIEEKKGPGISAACLMCCTDRLNQSCQTLSGTGWFYMACFITVPAGPGRSYCPHDDCPAQLCAY